MNEEQMVCLKCAMQNVLGGIYTLYYISLSELHPWMVPQGTQFHFISFTLYPSLSLLLSTLVYQASSIFFEQHHVAFDETNQAYNCAIRDTDNSDGFPFSSFPYFLALCTYVFVSAILNFSPQSCMYSNCLEHCPR